MIYFTSDPHLGHRFVLRNRPQFSTVDEMDDTIISNFNETLTNRDTLYFLGDAAFRLPPEEASKLLRQIHCKKILIRGNHDDEYEPGVFEDVFDYYEFKYCHRKFILFHYPITAWKQMRHGSIQLHGHLHSRPDYNERNHAIGRLQYDVGVDANGFKPVSIEQILDWAASSPWETYKGLNQHTTEDTGSEE